MESAKRTEATRHIDRMKSKFPDAFTASRPAGDVSDWLVDPVAKALSILPLSIPPAPPTDSEVVTQALLDKGSITQTELDAARQKLS